MKLELQNLKLQRLKGKLFYVGIFSVVTVTIWILLSVYVAFSKTTVDPEMKALIKPLNPTLDIETLQNYQATRVPPPEQFEITAFVTTDMTTKTTVKINPFDSSVAAVQGVTSSPSALLTSGQTEE